MFLCLKHLKREGKREREREIQKPFDRNYLKKEQVMNTITAIHPLYSLDMLITMTTDD